MCTVWSRQRRFYSEYTLCNGASIQHFNRLKIAHFRFSSNRKRTTWMKFEWRLADCCMLFRFLRWHSIENSQFDSLVFANVRGDFHCVIAFALTFHFLSLARSVSLSFCTSVRYRWKPVNHTDIVYDRVHRHRQNKSWFLNNPQKNSAVVKIVEKKLSFWWDGWSDETGKESKFPWKLIISLPLPRECLHLSYIQKMFVSYLVQWQCASLHILNTDTHPQSRQ